MNRLFLLHRLSGIPVAILGLVCLGFASASAQTADLAVEKLGPSGLVAGTDVTYTVLVSNVSAEQDSTPPTTLTDAVPSGMTFVSASADPGWNCNFAAGLVTCVNENPIVVEQVSSFTFVFHLGPNVEANTEICNTATIVSATDPNSQNNSSTTCGTVGAPPPPPLAPHDVLISEFRLSGPNGSNDEFIELYCNRATDCDISASFLRAYDPTLAGDFTYTFPANTVIPARQYLLVGDSGGYSLSAYGALDFNVHNADVPDLFVDNEGLQIVSPNEGLVLDSVGFIGGGSDFQYIEGTGLQRTSGPRPSDQYAYVRKRTMVTNGLPQDTDNNANDFVLVSVTGTAHPGITDPPVLGAPGPQGLTSLLSYSNSQVPVSLVEPAVSKEVSPNRVRTGSGDSGTLSLRRSFTNNTSQAFNRIRFRVIEITTLNSPNTIGDQARLRLVTSGDAETFTNSQSRTVVIRGTILEFDSGTEPVQPMGGGLNSTVFVDLIDPETEDPVFILPGQTVDVQFLLNVDKAGGYRVYVYVEALPGEASPGDAAAKSKTLPRRMIDLRRTARPASVKKLKARGAIQATSANIVPVRPAPATSNAKPTTAPFARAFIINRPLSEPVKKSRKKIRLRRTTSSALKVKAEAKH